MMMDFFEMAEARCEQWSLENMDGDSFTCCCGNTCKLEQGEALTPDPYAIPVCPSCFEKAMDEKHPGWRDKT